MLTLETVYTGVIATAGGATSITILRYFNFFRKNKVEDRTTETERLEAENKRAGVRADDAESDAQRYYAELLNTRRDLFDEQEYVARLRAFIHSRQLDPPERGK
jgi:hypothetical protein